MTQSRIFSLHLLARNTNFSIVYVLFSPRPVTSQLFLRFPAVAMTHSKGYVEDTAGMGFVSSFHLPDKDEPPK